MRRKTSHDLKTAAPLKKKAALRNSLIPKFVRGEINRQILSLGYPARTNPSDLQHTYGQILRRTW